MEAALEGVRPILARDGGDVRLVRIEGTIALVEFLGQCVGCPSQAVTMRLGIARAVLEACPELVDVLEAPKERPVGSFGSYIPAA